MMLQRQMRSTLRGMLHLICLSLCVLASKLGLLALLSRRIDPRVATSFRQAPQSDGAPALSVKVSVMPPSPPDPALKASIDNMEYRRSDEERAGFEQARLLAHAPVCLSWDMDIVLRGAGRVESVDRFRCARVAGPVAACRASPLTKLRLGLPSVEVQIQGHSNSALSVVKPVRQSRSTSFLQAAGGQLPAQVRLILAPFSQARLRLGQSLCAACGRCCASDGLELLRALQPRSLA